MRKYHLIFYITLTVIVIFLLQASIFLYLSKNKKTGCDADLLIIYPSNDFKLCAATAFHLLKSHHIRYFAATGYSKKNIQRLFKNFGYTIPKNTHIVDGFHSRTTFEDILCTEKIIKKHHLSSVSLITAKCHLPRAYLLSKVYFRNIAINPYCPKKGSCRYDELDFRSIKILYSECFQLWGSLVEMAGYKITGKPIIDFRVIDKTRKFIKGHLLFE